MASTDGRASGAGGSGRVTDRGIHVTTAFVGEE